MGRGGNKSCGSTSNGASAETEAVKLLKSWFPEDVEPTVEQFIKDLGLNEINPKVSSLATFINDQELEHLRREMSSWEQKPISEVKKERPENIKSGLQIMLKLRTLLRVPGGTYWKDEGVEEPVPWPFKPVAREASEENKDKEKEKENPKNKGKGKEPEKGKRKQPARAPSPPEEEPATNGFRFDNNDDYELPAPEPEPEPEQENGDEDMKEESDDEPPPNRKRPASPPLEAPMVAAGGQSGSASSKKKIKLEEIHLAIPNHAQSTDLDIARTPKGLGRYPFVTKIREYPDLLTLSFENRLPRMELTPSARRASSVVPGIKLKVTVQANGTANVDLPDSSLFSALHAATFAIKQISPISSHHWGKKDFRQDNPDWEEKDLVNPYAGLNPVEMMPVEPRDALTRDLKEKMTVIAGSRDPCRAVKEEEEYDGECEFCKGVTEWNGEEAGRNKLEEWNRVRYGNAGGDVDSD